MEENFTGITEGTFEISDGGTGRGYAPDRWCETGRVQGFDSFVEGGLSDTRDGLEDNPCSLEELDRTISICVENVGNVEHTLTLFGKTDVYPNSPDLIINVGGFPSLPSFTAPDTLATILSPDPLAPFPTTNLPSIDFLGTIIMNPNDGFMYCLNDSAGNPAVSIINNATYTTINQIPLTIEAKRGDTAQIDVSNNEIYYITVNNDMGWYNATTTISSFAAHPVPGTIIRRITFVPTTGKIWASCNDNNIYIFDTATKTWDFIVVPFPAPSAIIVPFIKYCAFNNKVYLSIGISVASYNVNTYALSTNVAIPIGIFEFNTIDNLMYYQSTSALPSSMDTYDLATDTPTGLFNAIPATASLYDLTYVALFNNLYFIELDVPTPTPTPIFSYNCVSGITTTISANPGPGTNAAGGGYRRNETIIHDSINNKILIAKPNDNLTYRMIFAIDGLVAPGGTGQSMIQSDINLNIYQFCKAKFTISLGVPMNNPVKQQQIATPLLIQRKSINGKIQSYIWQSLNQLSPTTYVNLMDVIEYLEFNSVIDNDFYLRYVMQPGMKVCMYFKLKKRLDFSDYFYRKCMVKVAKDCGPKGNPLYDLAIQQMAKEILNERLEFDGEVNFWEKQVSEYPRLTGNDIADTQILKSYNK